MTTVWSPPLATRSYPRNTRASVPAKLPSFVSEKSSDVMYRIRVLQFWGRKFGRVRFYGAREKLRSFCRKRPQMSVKFQTFRGGVAVYWVWAPIWECRFYFYWARGFSELVQHCLEGNAPLATNLDLSNDQEAEKAQFDKLSYGMFEARTCLSRWAPEYTHLICARLKYALYM